MTDSKVDVTPAAADQGSGAAPSSTPVAVTSFQAVTSQEDLDRIISNRLAREQAKFADYDTYKEKADKFDQAEDAKRSELEKIQQRAEQAERERDELKSKDARRQLVDQVSKDKDVPTHLLSGSTKEELEASADALAAWRGAVPTTTPNPTPGPRPVPQQGSPSKTDKPSGIAAGEEAARRKGWIK